MSGEKCAQASLAREAQENLNRELDLIQEITTALARAANLARQSESLVADLGRDVEVYMPGQLTAFQATLHTFDTQRQHLQALLEQLTALSRGRASGALVEEVRQRRTNAETLLQGLEQRAEEVRTHSNQLYTGLEDARVEHLQARVARQKTRRDLVGLRAELARRLEPRAIGSLQWVAQDAMALLHEVDQHLAQPASVLDAQRLIEWRDRLAQLVGTAEECDRQDGQRRRIAALLDQAFEASGFQRVPSEESSTLYDPVRSRHEYQRPDSTATIYSTIPMHGPIDFVMLGPSGHDTAVYGADQLCESHLHKIILQAQALGLDIRDVYVKNPSGSGWSIVPVDVDETDLDVDETDLMEHAD